MKEGQQLKPRLPGRAYLTGSMSPWGPTWLPHRRKSSENAPLPGSHRWVMREWGVPPSTALSAPTIQLLHIPACRPPTPTETVTVIIPAFIHTARLSACVLKLLLDTEQDRGGEGAFCLKMLRRFCGNQLSHTVRTQRSTMTQLD